MGHKNLPLSFFLRSIVIVPRLARALIPFIVDWLCFYRQTVRGQVTDHQFFFEGMELVLRHFYCNTAVIIPS